VHFTRLFRVQIVVLDPIDFHCKFKHPPKCYFVFHRKEKVSSLE